MAAYQLRKRTVQREELFRIVTENAADMIALVNIKGGSTAPPMRKFLGYTPEELEKTRRSSRSIQKIATRSSKHRGRPAAPGIGKKLEYRIRHKNGEWRILESAASTIRDKHGKSKKLVIVNRDITERKHTEKLLDTILFTMV